MEQYDEMGDQFIAAKHKFFDQEPDWAWGFILGYLTDTQGKAVADIGCGPGDDVVVLEKVGFAKVCGVDPSQKMVAQAKAVVKNPDNIRQGDFEHTTLDSGSLDYVVGRYSLHYVENIDSAYEEVARILKPGGLLVVSVDHPTADMIEGERFIKGNRQYVRIGLYNKSVMVEFPLHNFSDYFSKRFLELFELLEIAEPTGKDREYQDGPNALGFAARKRG